MDLFTDTFDCRGGKRWTASLETCLKGCWYCTEGVWQHRCDHFLQTAMKSNLPSNMIALHNMILSILGLWRSSQQGSTGAAS